MAAVRRQQPGRILQSLPHDVCHLFKWHDLQNRKYKQTVVESNSDQVTYEYLMVVDGRTTRNNSPVTREVWIRNCRNPDSSSVVTGTGNENVSVPAGSFDTEWTTFRTVNGPQVTNSKSWMHKKATTIFW